MKKRPAPKVAVEALPQIMRTLPNRPLDKKSCAPLSGRIVGLGRFLGLKPQVAFADYGAPDSHHSH
jgi:hypothetical protein